MVAQDRREIRDADELIAKWIEPDPIRGGRADARLKQFGVQVWALAGYAPLGEADPIKLAIAYDIPVEAAEAALAYYERHSVIIEARIADNSASLKSGRLLP